MAHNMLTLKSIRHPKCELPSNALAHKYLSQTKSPDKEPLMLEYCINTISHIQTQPTKTSFSASLLISLVFNCNLNNIWAPSSTQWEMNLEWYTRSPPFYRASMVAFQNRSDWQIWWWLQKVAATALKDLIGYEGSKDKDYGSAGCWLVQKVAARGACVRGITLGCCQPWAVADLGYHGAWRPSTRSVWVLQRHAPGPRFVHCLKESKRKDKKYY